MVIRCFGDDITKRGDDVKNIAPVISENKYPSPKVATLKRGTGGRSSFNGTVATVFGASGFLGRALVNRLGKMGTQVVVPYRGDPSQVQPLKLAGDLGQILFMVSILLTCTKLPIIVIFSRIICVMRTPFVAL